jgi:hypothetical protein
MQVVNGYPLRNLSDMTLAKQGVDPARPNDGPNGVYRPDRVEALEKAEATAQRETNKPVERGPAVTFGGALAGVIRAERQETQDYIPGTVADLRA